MHALDLQPIPNPVHNKALWSDKVMDIDDILAESPQPLTHMEGSSQQILMEEEPESFDLGDIDIFSPEKVCKRKEFDTIPDI